MTDKNKKEKICSEDYKIHSEKENKKVEDACSCSTCSCDEDKDNYLELAQRIQAEFDNYRKRSTDIVRVARQDGVIDAVGKILPALDSIQKAKTMIKDETVLEGVNLIEKEIKNSLKVLEIEEIVAEGQQFDPKMHNVIAVKYDNSLEDGIITDVYQAGYKIKERIIRYAQVIANKNKED